MSNSRSTPPAPPSLTRRHFGALPDGRAVEAFTLDDGQGLRLSVIPWGAVVTRLEAPDRDGRPGNVVLGFDTLQPYLANRQHLGAVAGRFANRIAGGRFVLDGRTVQTARNDGDHTLHGGPRGLAHRLWDAQPLDDAPAALRLSCVSDDGDNGFPGRLEVSVTYRVAHGCWQIDYEARSDAPTVVNLTQHSYFNLRGEGSALEQELTLAASRYLPVDATLIPLQPAAVDGTPFDFRAPARIVERVRSPHEQLIRARGFDHTVLLDGAGGAAPAFAARLHDPASGRVMEVHTTEPGLQFYSGNFLDGTLPAHGGRLARQGDGVCLEAHHFPDSPNRPDFPSTRLDPGQTFRSRTEYRFSVQR